MIQKRRLTTALTWAVCTVLFVALFALAGCGQKDANSADATTSDLQNPSASDGGLLSSIDTSFSEGALVADEGEGTQIISRVQTTPGTNAGATTSASAPATASDSTRATTVPRSSLVPGTTVATTRGSAATTTTASAGSTRADTATSTTGGSGGAAATTAPRGASTSAAATTVPRTEQPTGDPSIDGGWTPVIYD